MASPGVTGCVSVPAPLDGGDSRASAEVKRAATLLSLHSRSARTDGTLADTPPLQPLRSHEHQLFILNFSSLDRRTNSAPMTPIMHCSQGWLCSLYSDYFTASVL